MRFIVLCVVLCACWVTSCEAPPESLSATQINATVQAAVATAKAEMLTPSPTGTITRTPTPSATPTATTSPKPTTTPTLPTPSITPSPTVTRTPSVTPLPPNLVTTILGCDIGFDLTHGMGQVTNAYARVRNLGGIELTNVCLTLNASDEGRVHPDKSHCFSLLPVNYEVTTKLTVDTQSNTVSSIDVVVTSNQNLGDQVSGAGCRALDSSQQNAINSILNKPQLIPKP